MGNKYLEAVESLNTQIYDSHDEEELSFWYRTNGFVDQIGFDDKVLWCSEADGTQYIEDTDEEMAIEYVVKKAFNTYANRLAALRFEGVAEI